MLLIERSVCFLLIAGEATAHNFTERISAQALFLNKVIAIISDVRKVTATLTFPFLLLYSSGRIFSFVANLIKEVRDGK